MNEVPYPFGFVEFKIYISLKQNCNVHFSAFRFVEFKIYISLKLDDKDAVVAQGFVEFKIYISLKQRGKTNSEFRVL